MRYARWALRAAVVLLAAAGCKQADQAAQAPAAGPAPGTAEWKVQNAMSAAPASIASAATLMDLGTNPDSAPTQLRAGTNGWTCFADNAATPGNDPMCMDAQFSNWVTAWVQHKAPSITGIGLGYMLQGGSDASNTDPFKMQPDSGHAWVDTGPHVMVVVPNVRALTGLSTDHSTGGPYIMFQGTPYAHVMMPVAPAASRM